MIVLIYLSGWFSGTETALTNLNVTEIAEMRKKNEKNVDYVIESKRDMDKTLVTILIGNNVVNIILSSVAAVIANELFQAIGVTIMILAITILIIIFGEITPKANAIWDSKKVAQKNSKAIYYLSRAISPFVTFFMSISRGIIRLTGKKFKKTNLLVTDESIRNMATLGEEEGVIKSIEKDIIHRVFIFGDKKIKDVMVPIEKVFNIEKDLSIKEASKIIARKGFSRVPVIDKNNKVIGVINSKDLIDKDKGLIKILIKPPFFISDSDEITDIFNSMKEKRIHIAMVQDNKGNIIGIVTLEDILEEIVGEIYDEYFEKKYGIIMKQTPLQV
jgi:CBS domain containing-hemolysin-like protein